MSVARSQRADRVVAALLGMLWACVAMAEARPVAADWVPRELDFSYAGVSTFYSCDGLERKLKWLLGTLGVRPGMTVSTYCTHPLGGPSRLSGAHLKFSVLVPREEGAASDAAAAPSMGEWRLVQWQAGKPGGLQEGDCELVEQFERQVLPAASTREHRDRVTCTPGTVSLGSFTVEFEVLVPLPPPAAMDKP
jgi:hypothetical protein